MPKSARTRHTRGTYLRLAKQEEHVPDDRLKRYAVTGTLPEPEMSRVEEHLLVCPSCHDRLAVIDTRRAALDKAGRAGERQPVIPLWQIHQTPDGLVRLWVETAGDGWAACSGDANWIAGSSTAAEERRR